MEKEIIKQAATVEEAKALIMEELGLPEDSITFEVLQQPGKKLLGLFGGNEAEVKGTATVSAAQVAKTWLEDVLHGMGVNDFTCSVQENDNGCVIKLDGDNLGFIIGRRGETLDALQYLTGLVGNRVGSAYYRVTLDIGNYRDKREQSLISLARRLGNQVIRTGRRRSLEPMNPYERRIIHTAVQEMEGITSWSVGTEPARHVVIGLADENAGKDTGEEHRSQGGRGRGGNRGGRGNGGRGGRGGERREGRGGERRGRRDDDYQVTAPERPVREFISRSNPLPMADGATPPSRTESEKEDSLSLYGRIDI